MTSDLISFFFFLNMLPLISNKCIFKFSAQDFQQQHLKMKEQRFLIIRGTMETSVPKSFVSLISLSLIATFMLLRALKSNLFKMAATINRFRKHKNVYKPVVFTGNELKFGVVAAESDP